MTTLEIEQRILALETRLRIEEFVSRCLDLAAPYLNAEDKVGWRVGDALKFLKSEIDPAFLGGRQVAISLDVPDVENPTEHDYEQLDWSQPVSEPDINLQALVRHWNSMGQLLHCDLSGKRLDIEKAKKQIERANQFCDALTTGIILLNSDIQVVTQTCSAGHLTKRNVMRLKPRQIIPCMHHQCASVFIVERIEPLVWQEFFLQITCDDCGAVNRFPPKPLIDLSYWERALVPCGNKGCDGQIEVQWVLSKTIDKVDRA